MTANRPKISNLEDSDLLKIANELFEQFSGNFKDSDISANHIFQSIKEIGNQNGYEYAKHLEEDHGVYNIDSIIVEALDCIQWSLWDVQKVKEKEWVLKNNITPLYKVGDTVSYKRGKNSIHKIDYKYGQYQINTDKENTKAVVNFEDVIEDNNV